MFWNERDFILMGENLFVCNNLVCSWKREQYTWNHLTENSRNARNFTKSLQLPCFLSNHAELTAISSSKDLHNKDLKEGLVLSMPEWFKENEGTYFFMMHYVTTERAMWGIKKLQDPHLISSLLFIRQIFNSASSRRLMKHQAQECYPV